MAQLSYTTLYATKEVVVVTSVVNDRYIQHNTNADQNVNQSIQIDR